MFQNRVLLSKNGTLSDLSDSVKDIYSQVSTLNIVAAQDYVYLGSLFPFNHRFFWMGTVNTSASLIDKVQVWDGSEWKDCVDVLDGTKGTAGKTLSQNGIIQWQIPKNVYWASEDTNYNGSTIDGLTTVVIFDMYWARIKFTADLLSSTSVKYIGQKFSSDDDLRIEYAELMRGEVLDSVESNKTDWMEQTIRAAEYIGEDLKRKNVICSKNQILSVEEFKSASIHKTAEIIYGHFGTAFVDQKKAANKEYEKSLARSIYFIDSNSDGKVDIEEATTRQGVLYR